ncbi:MULTISPECIES: hypothetical protein [Flavobacterium]|uniref:DUF4352 domain-containing protein n=1 Tax=Flavobacterium jumunjinense TaxID=998845 RepID=A0ABV5GLN4_9FLAO|nr:MULTISPECIES: hypothetical protein [Flavobacterium]
MKKTLIFFTIFVVVLFLIISYKNPIIGKYIVGSARIIGEKTKSEVYCNQLKIDDAKLFLSKSNFEETEKRNHYILYFRNVKAFEGIPVVIVDIESNSVCIPNASLKDYDIVLGSLFQSESGAKVMIPIDNELKGLNFDPDLKVSFKKISFHLLVNNEIREIVIDIG